MNINLKLKERRTKINKHKQHQKIKAVRQYKKEIKNNDENPDEEVNKKIARFLENESKEKLESDNTLQKENITVENKTKIKEKEEKEIKKEKEEKEEKKKNWREIKKNEKLLGRKRKEEEREKQIQKRKKEYQNLKKTNKYGQPIMKFQLQHLFNKIKNKKALGLI